MTETEFLKSLTPGQLNDYHFRIQGNSDYRCFYGEDEVSVYLVIDGEKCIKFSNEERLNDFIKSVEKDDAIASDEFEMEQKEIQAWYKNQ